MKKHKAHKSRIFTTILSVIATVIIVTNINNVQPITKTVPKNWGATLPTTSTTIMPQTKTHPS